jgi:hypothetical protein
MEFIKLLIVLILLSDGAEALAQEQRLIDAAKKEGGKVSIYGSPETPVVDAVIQAFQKKTGLSADYWRASAMSVMNRAMSEYRAGNALYDVVLKQHRSTLHYGQGRHGSQIRFAHREEVPKRSD